MCCPVCSHAYEPAQSDGCSFAFTPAVILDADGTRDVLHGLRRIQVLLPNHVCVCHGRVHVRGSYETLEPVGMLFAVLGARYNNRYLYYYAEIILGFRERIKRLQVAYVGEPES